MNKQTSWLLVLISSLLIPAPAFADWEPTFVDNFNGSELDPAAWAPGREVLPRRIQFYDKDALEVSDGKLKITVLNRAESDRPYATGVVTTQGLFKQKYGYFEMRAKIPAGDGFWPAFWMMPESGQWTSEIDIAEFQGDRPTGVTYAYHYGNQLRVDNGKEQQLPVDVTKSFNTFAVNWTPDRIAYRFNGRTLHTITDPARVANASDEMFMIINLALASQHTGFIPVVDEDTDLTQSYEIDYVRVYKAVEDGQYENLPSPGANVPNLRPVAYDNTALSVDRVLSADSADIMRSPGRISGEIELFAHKPNYSGQVSVFLAQLVNFNLSNGRYDKSAVIEERSFDISMAQTGDTQNINYAFDTVVSEPGAYVVDVLIKDLATNRRKRLSQYRVVQLVDSERPDTTVFFEGFFRAGSASYDDGVVNGTLQLQLQQALLASFLNLNYQLVDINSGEILLSEPQTYEHPDVGLQTLSPSIAATLDTDRSIALIVDVIDSSQQYVIKRFGVHVGGTAPPPADWGPGVGPLPPGGATIPMQNWEATFVDNFDGPELNLNNWVHGRDHVFRRLNYYDKDALSIENGFLNISVLNRAESDRSYTTGVVSTQGLFKQKYGYFEIRAKIPKGDGFWPAFWLMPESGRWSSEIDISEFRGHLPDEVHHAFHYGFKLRSETGGNSQVPGDLSDSYNNFAAYWTPERIDYLFNGTIVHSVTGEEAVANAGDEMFVVLNMALASQHSGWIPTPKLESDLSQAYSIDYVRVYQADPNGPHAGIPDVDAVVPDVSGAGYDATAASIDRVESLGESDIMRSPGIIRGQVEITGQKANYTGIASVMLAELFDFNVSDGRFSKSAAIEALNYRVTLNAVGDTQIIDYEFSPTISTPGVYSVDVVIKDTTTQNKRGFSGHRVVQYVDSSQPATTVHFEGFFRESVANYSDGTIEVLANLQKQQALLAAHLNVEYIVVDSVTGAVAAQVSESIEHNDVGLQDVQKAISAALDESRDYDLVINVTDSGDTFAVGSLILPVGGVGTRPVGGGGGVPGIDPDPKPLENILHGISGIIGAGGLDVTMDITLDDIEPTDNLLYNVKFFSLPDNVLTSKLTGSAGSGFSRGRNDVSFQRPDAGAVTEGDYRSVVFLYKNAWTEEDRLLVGAAPAGIAGGGL